MTDYEKYSLVKNMLDKLANGQNPFNDEPLPFDTILNNIHISRALFIASEAVSKAIEAEKKGKKKPEFSISEEELSRFRYSNTPIYITEISNRINELKEDDYMKKFSYTTLTKWLVEKGLLVETVYNEKKCKKATEAGNSLGIHSELRENFRIGKHMATTYDINAQHFIIDNLPAILEETKS